MYSAREVGSGQIVFASKAKTYRNYACPVCKAEVFLRAGQYRGAHFAHKSGMGSEDCNLYHPSFDIQTPLSPTTSGWTTDPDFKIRPKYLSIEIDKGRNPSSSASRNWSLNLTLPQAPTDKGLIHIDLGREKRRIPLSKLVLSEQTYPVDIGSSEFRALWRSPEVPDDYFEAVSDRVQLSESLASAFDVSPLKHKPFTRRLVWGEYYYFIWPSAVSSDFPNDFTVQQLAKRGDWSCALVQLPEQAEMGPKEWLKKFCGLAPERQSRKWAIAHPAPRRRNIYGEISVSSLDNVVVGYFQPTSDEWTIGAVADGEAQSFALQDVGWHLFEYTSDAKAEYGRLRLRSDEQDLAALVSEELEHKPATSVQVFFRDRASGRVTDQRLHQEQVLAQFQGVRSRKSDIAEVRVPERVSGWLKLHNCRTGAYSEEKLCTDNTSSDIGRKCVLEATALAKLNSSLAAEETEVVLDFGHFGICAFPPLSRRREQADQLLPSLRKKILWLCSQSNNWRRRDGVAIARLSDARLVEHYAAARFDTRWMAHVRSIVHQLERSQSKRLLTRGARQ